MTRRDGSLHFRAVRGAVLADAVVQAGQERRFGSPLPFGREASRLGPATELESAAPRSSQQVLRPVLRPVLQQALPPVLPPVLPPALPPIR
jgi:hypothetical protein